LENKEWGDLICEICDNNISILLTPFSEPCVKNKGRDCMTMIFAIAVVKGCFQNLLLQIIMQKQNRHGLVIGSISLL